MRPHLYTRVSLSFRLSVVCLSDTSLPGRAYFYTFNHEYDNCLMPQVFDESSDKFYNVNQYVWTPKDR